jgi:hypothetical protein
MTYPGLSMWNESTKIHYFMDFLPLLLLEAVKAMDVTFNQIISQMSASHECTYPVFMT